MIYPYYSDRVHLLISRRTIPLITFPFSALFAPFCMLNKHNMCREFLRCVTRILSIFISSSRRAYRHGYMNGPLNIYNIHVVLICTSAYRIWLVSYYLFRSSFLPLFRILFNSGKYSQDAGARYKLSGRGQNKHESCALLYRAISTCYVAFFTSLGFQSIRIQSIS